MRSIRRWLKTYDEEMELRESERGRHSKSSSPIVDPTFREKFCNFVRTESRKPGAIFSSNGHQAQMIKRLCIALRTSSANHNDAGHMG